MVAHTARASCALAPRIMVTRAMLGLAAHAGQATLALCNISMGPCLVATPVLWVSGPIKAALDPSAQTCLAPRLRTTLARQVRVFVRSATMVVSPIRAVLSLGASTVQLASGPRNRPPAAHAHPFLVLVHTLASQAPACAPLAFRAKSRTRLGLRQGAPC